MNENASRKPLAEISVGEYGTSGRRVVYIKREGGITTDHFETNEPIYFLLQQIDKLRNQGYEVKITL